MFSSAIKGNQRCNGLYSSPQETSVGSKVINNTTKHYNNTTYKLVNKIDRKDVYSNSKKGIERQRTVPITFHNSKPFNGNSTANEVTKPPFGKVFEDKVANHSIIGLNDSSTPKPPLVLEQKVKKEIKSTHHETLQRIESETDEYNYYQQHWFSPSLEKMKLEDRSREERIEITRHEFLRKLQQMLRSNVGKPNKMPSWIERRRDKVVTKLNKRKDGNVNVPPPKLCEVNECGKPSMIFSKYCAVHIMYDSRQVLFDYCTAKFADNTQCSLPVFDISHELPLCAEHARKRDNYRLYQEAKPKKIRKKVKPSAMIRPQKRNKKKRKPPPPKQTETLTNSSSIMSEINTNSNELVTQIETTPSPELEDLHMVDQVLALNENGLEQALVSQAHLLEETDITNVLSTIQVDEFSDFFAVNRNGEYEPSREEAEELEKALAAVDNDVKSLEKLSQSHGLLDSFLDEHALTDSLAQIPEMMFHNGYAACGDSIVAQSSSYLLPVEPHSHS
ncbi:INO80 complex subunit D [Dendroctonus ponderosae]|uniref:KANL2-like probable zinc-finger domain-containing protein n=1 Tax=Dendroctonus ponderosae TaxID=77166 RepID=A0AAR5PUH1_DENPD|nr:INO80 complex subunit D [Dendroctonus ponderosae]KAH1007415.1 hypothetical protein HUJ04_004653 [Dendroctonus ponderosae]KAH1007416.1 hypothetical protein HUJ04_004653 [Dendroctonus ponderosae]KAH1007417.1 hypothetical protein HUJ04_004653 [Dendroctonus ponderosae]KAH1014918.1 hypothetical protein HUJ05_012724 [Dendroctonus ponderosae]KAH1014919.1 hypothetical protein HUJ05_012724 [Dendroctonus ponderosae]